MQPLNYWNSKCMEESLILPSSNKVGYQLISVPLNSCWGTLLEVNKWKTWLRLMHLILQNSQVINSGYFLTGISITTPSFLSFNNSIIVRGMWITIHKIHNQRVKTEVLTTNKIKLHLIPTLKLLQWTINMKSVIHLF